MQKIKKKYKNMKGMGDTMARQIGLKDIHIAILKKDDSTGIEYETPIKLERAIDAKLSPKISSEKLYSDDNLEEIVQIFDSIDVEIGLNQLSLESRALLQGSKLVKGTLLETKSDIVPTLALGFKSKKGNGRYRYVWLYKGKFEMTSDEYETETDKVKTSTASLKGSFYARDNDGAYRFFLDEDAKDVDTATKYVWFDSVQEQPSA
ncbi:MAG: phage tail protein [Vallitalea sp.]|jgi:phi13 family phage major tail protein|nr:phage tail protein [Vallitalea sp.]